MSVSSVSSGQNVNQAAFQQRKADFTSLQNSLQGGDLTGAQQAFSAFQQDVQGSGNGSKLANDPKYQTLQTALQNGDLSGAQQAFSALQQDMQAHKGHHHGHGGGKPADGDGTAAAPAADASGTNPATDLNAQIQAAQAAATSPAAAVQPPGAFVNVTT